MQFIGSDYRGLTTSDGKRFDGLGQFIFPNGDCYVGGMLDGVFHGHGILFFRKRDNARSEEAGKQCAADEGAAAGAAAEDDGKAELLGFLDGCGKGGDKVNAGSPRVPAAAAAADGDEDAAAGWSGQFRGVWEYGRNVTGSYLFFDGLVYISETHPSGLADRQRQQQQLMAGAEAAESAAHPLASHAAEAADALVWPYCECKDRRVWSEHLRNITPVLPYESPLGGIALQEALAAAYPPNGARQLWADMPILVPSSPETDLAPSAFAQGQPKSGAEIAAWERALDNCCCCCGGGRAVACEGGESEAAFEALQAIAEVLELPTEPLVEEQDPDVEIDAEGNTHSRRRRVPNPNYTPRYLLSRTLQSESGDGGSTAVAGPAGRRASKADTVSGDGHKRALTPSKPVIRPQAQPVVAAIASGRAALPSAPNSAAAPISEGRVEEENPSRGNDDSTTYVDAAGECEEAVEAGNDESAFEADKYGEERSSPSSGAPSPPTDVETPPLPSEENAGDAQDVAISDAVANGEDRASAIPAVAIEKVTEVDLSSECPSAMQVYVAEASSPSPVELDAVSPEPLPTVAAAAAAENAEAAEHLDEATDEEREEEGSATPEPFTVEVATEVEETTADVNLSPLGAEAVLVMKEADDA